MYIHIHIYDKNNLTVVHCDPRRPGGWQFHQGDDDAPGAGDPNLAGRTVSQPVNILKPHISTLRLNHVITM